MPFPSSGRTCSLALTLACAAFFASVDASASPVTGGGWQEAHRSADDVRIAVGPDGLARVEHHVRYRVVAGRFRSFELTGAFDGAELEPEAHVTVETSPEVRPGAAAKDAKEAKEPKEPPPAHVERSPKTPGALRITIDDPKGLPRGSYVVDVAYKLDLVATKAIVRDGAMWRLAWTAPAAPEGMDGARVTFELPAAPTEPSLASSEQSSTTIATARHAAGKDELELVRAHVPRGESVTWAVRVDPKAFPQVTSPELRTSTPVAPAVTAPKDEPRALATAAGLALVAVVLGVARKRKQAALARACAASGALPRPLVPVPASIAPFAYGLSAALALAAFLGGSVVVGSSLLVAAMALGAFRPPRVVARPRGPGRWAEVEDADVLVAPAAVAGEGDALDLGTRRGRVTALVVVAIVAAVAALLREHVPYAHVAVPLVATALVPLFATGTRAQLPPSPIALAARFLAPARDALAASVDLSHAALVPIARLREGTKAVDEVRLACAPAVRIPGLRAIELALATSSEAPEAPIPQVLVRFDDASAAAAKVAAIAPGMAVVVGRAPEEKVLRVTPRVPTASSAARLVARLLGELEGRREGDRVAAGESVAPPPAPPFRGPERRGRKRRGGPFAPPKAAAARTAAA